MCAELIEERRGRDDLDDLISILTNAKDDGALSAGGMAEGQEVRRATAPDAATSCSCSSTLLVVAGNETTRNALTGGMLAFSLFPDQKAEAARRPRPHRPRRRRDRPVRDRR